jgi:RNA polymerase sigma factor (sigma-70 family)
MATGQLTAVIQHLRQTALRSADEGLTDGELLGAFLARQDHQAFESLLWRHGPMVLGVCRRILRHAHDAEEAFQATFLVLVRRAASVVPREAVGNWLYGVAYRTALEARRARARRQAREKQMKHVPHPQVEPEQGWHDLQPILDQELSRLPDKYRIAVVLCDLEGRTCREVARRLGVPERTLSGRLTAARQTLAQRLSRRGVVLSAGALAAVLNESKATAALPLTLVASTVNAATAFAAGQAAVAGVIAPRVAELTEGVLRTMRFRHLEIATAILLLVTVVGAGLAGWAIPDVHKAAPAGGLGLIRSTRSGPWSAPETWEGGKVPGEKARAQIRQGHTVTYDSQLKVAIRSIHVAGTLTFARDRSTHLEVGLIKIQPGEDAGESGFDCDAHVPLRRADEPRPALEVGTRKQPIPAKWTATIQLRYCEGMDRESCPAIVCCGGRMDFHGAPLARTWLKLAAPARAGDREVTLAEPPVGWRLGDRVILTATTRQHKPSGTFRPSVRDRTQTEERTVKGIDGTKLTLDRPLAYAHQGGGSYRGEVANLSRNVVVESADPQRARGHTMYHRHSAGSISYAELRHLGKEGVLGRYSLHYHLAGDTMRGSSVIGASIWDSDNRWLTIHGTNYLVVRDCVGYQSKGHGFFLEDGTEVYNVLDHNLAVQAYTARPLPQQVIPFDRNDGSGFWWANSHNSFTRNVACECDEYGYFFQAAKTADFDPVLPVQQPDGSRKKVDIRTLPFIRFEDNEAHCQRRHGFNLGGGVPFGKPNVDGIGPDARHPFVIRNLKLWNVHWAIHPVAPSLLLDNVDIHKADYGIWRPEYNRHAYRRIRFDQVSEKTHFGFDGEAPNQEADFPKPLDPVDDLPPVTVITHTRRLVGDKLEVRGSSTDNGEVKKVLVNGRPARAVQANFAEWVVVLEGVRRGMSVRAWAEDASGNVEKRPHVLQVQGLP